MQKQGEITWRGLALEFKGYYEQGDPGDWQTAPVRSSFETEEVLFNKTNVLDVLVAANVDMIELEEKVIKQIEDK